MSTSNDLLKPTRRLFTDHSDEPNRALPLGGPEKTGLSPEVRRQRQEWTGLKLPGYSDDWSTYDTSMVISRACPPPTLSDYSILQTATRPPNCSTWSSTGRVRRPSPGPGCRPSVIRMPTRHAQVPRGSNNDFPPGE